MKNQKSKNGSKSRRVVGLVRVLKGKRVPGRGEGSMGSFSENSRSPRSLLSLLKQTTDKVSKYPPLLRAPSDEERDAPRRAHFLSSLGAAHSTRKMSESYPYPSSLSIALCASSLLTKFTNANPLDSPVSRLNAT